MKNFFNKCIILSIFTLANLIGGETNQVSVLAISGLNGLGASPEYIQDTIGVRHDHVTCVSIPSITRDLGQENCMKHLRNALNNLQQDEKCLIYAASQGAATALNYLALYDKGQKIKGLILEGCFASGNSAIQHTMSGRIAGKFAAIGKLPLAHYWLLYAAQLVLPCYSPSAAQTIKSLKHVPKDIPIIIIHSTDDAQISYNDACALYYGLRKNGNNAHFFSFEGRAHFDILKTVSHREIIHKIHFILKQHGLINGQISDNGINSQPDYERYEMQYRTLMDKEKKHWIIGHSLKLSVFATLLSISCWGIYKPAVALMNGWKQFELEN